MRIFQHVKETNYIKSNNILRILIYFKVEI